MKKLVVTLVMFIAFLPAAMGAEFWGSKNSNKYHNPACVWAQKIKPGNLVKFQSPGEASKAGYIPCKVCKPSLSNKATLNDPNNDFYAQNGQQESIEKQGCCSWHGGVCGCNGNRVQCCDGTLSPSCMCGE